MSWDDLTEAIEEHSTAYNAMLDLRNNERAGTKKQDAAYAAWVKAHAQRAAVLLSHWTEDDGYIGEFKALGPVLRRYYADTHQTTGHMKRGAKT